MNLRPAATLFTLVMLTGLACPSRAQTLAHRNHIDATDRAAVVRYPAVRARPDNELAAHAAASSAATPLCGAEALSWAGRPLPAGEQGMLDGRSGERPATLNNQGRIAFTSLVNGAARNQGVFIADEQGLHVVALGCGGYGGSGDTATCGDATPIGGTFTGFFVDGWAMPVINDNGDVLFIADVQGGSGPRGLFLYRAADHSIVKVAAVNDPSPLGGTLSAVGTGSLNNDGSVAFIATTGVTNEADILLWKAGVTTKYVAVGDPVPGGGTFWSLASEAFGYADGSFVPGGPVPSINDKGQIAFRGLVSGGIAERGLFISQEGVHSWIVKAGELVPGGDAYLDFGAPLLNNAGDIAFYSDIAGSPGAAWVVGSPGHWRRALAWFDQFGGGTIWGLVLSRSPMKALNDHGDLLLWTSRLMPDNNELEAIVLNRANGETSLVAGQRDAKPLGGAWGLLEALPAVNNMNQLRIGTSTPGRPGEPDMNMLLTVCADDAVFRDGFDGEG